MSRNIVWSALTNNRLFVNSFLPVIVSVIIYVTLRYSLLDVQPSNEVTNNISNMLIHSTKNNSSNSSSSNAMQDHVQKHKSHFNALSANWSASYDNSIYLTPEAHASLWWLNRTMNTSSFKEWYNITNKIVQFTTDSSDGMDNKMSYANDVLSPIHVWYLYLAGNYMKACEYIINTLQMHQVHNAFFTGLQYILLSHRLYFQLSPLYLIVMFSRMYYAAQNVVRLVAILLLCALERRAMATLDDNDVPLICNEEKENKKNDKNDKSESDNKMLHARTREQLTDMGLTEERVTTLQHAITLMGIIILSVGLFAFSIVLEITTFHPVCMSTIMLLGVINALLQEEIESSSINEKDKKNIYMNHDGHATQINHAICELHEAQRTNYTETFCTERPIVFQRYLYYCLPRSLPSIQPLCVASLLMAALCLTESYYLYLLPLFVLWCMTSCYRRAFCRVLVCVKPPEGTTNSEANEHGFVEIGLSSYHDKWYMLRCVGNALTPAVLCVVMLLVMHEPTNNVQNVFQMIELLGKPPFPTLHAVQLTRKEHINVDNNHSNITSMMYKYEHNHHHYNINDNNNKYKLNNATNTFYNLNEIDENNTLVRMMRSLNSNMEYANQWELELSLTGGKELELHHEYELENCACAISNNSYYSCSRPTANLWTLTEYIGLPWSRMVMHIALILTLINNNLPNTSSFKLSSSESMSESLSFAEADYIIRAVADAQLMLDYFSLVIMVLVNAISLITLAFYRLRRPPPYFDNPKAFLSAQASYHAEAVRLYKQKEQERREANAKKHANNEEHNKKEEEENFSESIEQTDTIDSSNNKTSAVNKGKGKVKSKSDNNAVYKDVTKTCVCAHEYLLKNTIMYLFMSILIGLSASLFLIRTSVMSVTCTWPFVVVLFAMWSMNAHLRTELHHIYTRPAANRMANNTNNSEQEEKQNTWKGKATASNIRNRKDDKFFVSPYAHVSNLEETNNAYVETSTWCVSSPLSLFELYDVVCVNIMLGALLLSLTGSFASTFIVMIICYTVIKLFTLFIHWQSLDCTKRTERTKVQWSTKMLWWLFIGVIVFCITCAVALIFANSNVSPLVQEMCFSVIQKIELVLEHVRPYISDLLCLSRYYRHHRNYTDKVVFISRMATRFVAAAMFCAVIALIWLRLIHLNLQPDEVRLSTSSN